MTFMRKLLGLGDQAPVRSSDTETVRRIVHELGDLPPERARFLATFAYNLARVADADSQVSDEETARMEEIVTRFGGLTQAQAVLVVQIAKAQAELFGGTEDFLVTRQFRDASTPAQREELLHCLFAVSAADDSISSVEEAAIRQIAGELGMSDPEYLAVRAQYNAKRSVLKNLPNPPKS